MELKHQLKNIFSVSAASLALLQSTAGAKAKELQEIAGDFSQHLQNPNQSGGEKLVLAPADPERSAQLLAAHRSHSSHSSHSSHRSHYSGSGSGYPSTAVPSVAGVPVSPAPSVPANSPPV